MKNSPSICLALHGHFPYIPHSAKTGSGEETPLFESLSETWLPLLEMFCRLEADRVPFRLGLSLSPVFCHLLSDQALLSRFVRYLETQAGIGEFERRRLEASRETRDLASRYQAEAEAKRDFFVNRCGRRFLRPLDERQKTGAVELMTSAATHPFLPFYTGFPETMQAQFETAVSSFRLAFGRAPQGFWLPELGWSEELDSWLRSYNLCYTIVESHGLVFGSPRAERGTFYPAKTPLGVSILGRDFFARRDLRSLSRSPEFRNNRLAEELPREMALSLKVKGDAGYKYHSIGGRGGGGVYQPEAAREAAERLAALFLDRTAARLREAAYLLATSPPLASALHSPPPGPPLVVIACNADFFGRRWREGPVFLEALFREAARRGDIQMVTPSDYLCARDVLSFQTVTPGYSSLGARGYGETWLNASNDWMYRHALHGTRRMTELAERFPDSSGFRERTLNQAARELLLALSSDWPRLLAKQEAPEDGAPGGRGPVEEHLRNFTTIYESLGSGRIDAQWLLDLEKRDNIFPQINYRVFRHKR